LGEAEVLGVIDSVKTMGLSDGRTIQLSKNHGVLNFESTDGEIFSLSGIPDRQLGTYPIGRHEIFDFEVGDVFVYVGSYSATSEEYVYTLRRIEITDILENGSGELEFSYHKAIYQRTWQLMGESGQFYLEEIAPVYGQGESTVGLTIDLDEKHLCDA